MNGETTVKYVVQAACHPADVKRYDTALVMMRDPWGVCFQLCRRPEPMLKC